MSGTTTRGRQYYRCNGRNSGEAACTLAYFRSETIEQPVWNEISRWLEHPQALIAAQKTLAEHLSTNHNLTVSEKHLDETRKERDRLIDLVQKGMVSIEEVSKRMGELGERITKLNSTLVEYKGKKTPLPLPKIYETDSLSSLKNRIKTLNFDDKQKITRDLVHQVIVTYNELVIQARFSD